MSRIRPRVDSGPPRPRTHLRTRAKQIRMHLDNQSKIDYENRWLMDRIIAAKKVRTPRRPSTPGSLNRLNRMRKLYEVQIENILLAERLQTTRPTYDIEKFQDEYESRTISRQPGNSSFRRLRRRNSARSSTSTRSRPVSANLMDAVKRTLSDSWMPEATQQQSKQEQMVKSNNIQIFLRVRPTKKLSRGLVIDEENNSVSTHIVRQSAGDVVNNQREEYNYKFDGVLGMDVKQDTVFDQVAKDVVDSVLDGYNGTIFAYGQTGSGKTYTITGGAERYVDRGLIPRSISYIFSEVRRRTDMVFKVSVSYLEIYNQNGYDLLDESQSSRKLSDLPKVTPREDSQGRVILNNLNVHRADAEEDALNLLFIGDTNRVVAETPTNDASTRSHCVFIIQIEVQRGGSDTKTVSRLHLVDLAGSERIGKTGVTGQTQTEALYINVSLHYLEQVIVCLQKKSTGDQMHVPYRNSLMTMVLRDSLGGNCKTTMIANISAEDKNLAESVSTCNFAQRVACIKNSASRNEQVDPGLIIQRLKNEVSELKAEIRLLKGDENPRESLTPEELEECKRIVGEYIASRDPGMKIVVGDMLKIHECFFQLKRIINEGGLEGAKSINGAPTNDPEEVARLKMLVKQRDNEIAILLGHINKNKGVVLPSVPQQPQTSQEEYKSAIREIQPPSSEYVLRQEPIINTTPHRKGNSNVVEELQAPTDIKVTPEQLADRNKAFDLFRKSYRRNEAMEENKQLLKHKIGEAKGLTDVINGARRSIELIKNEIESIRRENAVQGLVDQANVPLEHPEEARLASEVEQHKIAYRDGVATLKALKGEIESIQKLLENSRKRMQSDFEAWLKVMVNQSSASSVDENLQAFYKARDEIYSSLPPHAS